jgi:hypothetical protein
MQSHTPPPPWFFYFESYHLPVLLTHGVDWYCVKALSKALREDMDVLSALDTVEVHWTNLKPFEHDFTPLIPRQSLDRILTKRHPDEVPTFKQYIFQYVDLKLQDFQYWHIRKALLAELAKQKKPIPFHTLCFECELRDEYVDAILVRQLQALIEEGKVYTTLECDMMNRKVRLTKNWSDAWQSRTAAEHRLMGISPKYYYPDANGENVNIKLQDKILEALSNGCKTLRDIIVADSYVRRSKRCEVDIVLVRLVKTGQITWEKKETPKGISHQLERVPSSSIAVSKVAKPRLENIKNKKKIVIPKRHFPSSIFSKQQTKPSVVMNAVKNLNSN